MKYHEIYLHSILENIHLTSTGSAQVLRLTSTSSAQAAQVFQNAGASLKITDPIFDKMYISTIYQFKS